MGMTMGGGGMGMTMGGRVAGVENGGDVIRHLELWIEDTEDPKGEYPFSSLDNWGSHAGWTPTLGSVDYQAVHWTQEHRQEEGLHED